MTVYRLDRAPALAVAGGAFVVAALSGFLAFVASSALAGVVTVVALVVAALISFRPPVVVRLDEHGIRTRRARERWVDVDDVTVRDGLLLLSLGEAGEEQRAMRVSLASVGARAPELVREVHDRLNTAHGYRRFGLPPGRSVNHRTPARAVGHAPNAGGGGRPHTSFDVFEVRDLPPVARKRRPRCSRVAMANPTASSLGAVGGDGGTPSRLVPRGSSQIPTSSFADEKVPSAKSAGGTFSSAEMAGLRRGSFLAAPPQIPLALKTRSTSQQRALGGRSRLRRWRDLNPREV